MKKLRKTKKPPTDKGQDRGSALILTLGMLMLVMTLFISFTIVAIYNQQSVILSESIVKARFQAATALQRVYALLASEWANTLDGNNAFPASNTSQTGFFQDPSGGWSGRNYWASLGTDTDGIQQALNVVIAGQTYTPNAELDPSVGWIHTIDPDGSGAIIARIAYVIIDESGKIDPTAVLQRADPDALPPISGSAEGTETRIGLAPNEISLFALYDSDTDARQLQSTDEAGGMLPDNARWFSHYYIFKNCPEIANSPTETITDTIFPFSYDIEAFFDGSGDKHRFDLTNAKWDDFANDIAKSKIDAAATDFWQDASAGLVNTNEGGIPWFANCATADLKNQVIANLIDYCDTDSIPTTDYDATAQPIPTYIGLEKLPFINELLFEVQVESKSSGGYGMVVSCIPELVNMWDAAAGGNAKLEVKITITATLQPDATAIKHEIIFGNDDGGAGEFELAADVLAETYQALPIDSQRIDAIGAALDMGTNDELTNISITINYAKLIDKTSKQLWDYAFSTEFPMLVGGETVAGGVTFISAEVNDPRHNMPIDQWTWSPTWEPLGTGSLGITNTICAPSNPIDTTTGLATNVLQDIEENAADPILDPWDISTAYIRNGAMKTLWELGAIHRGLAWQSINLTAYNETVDSTIGLDDYGWGDGNLLDQVKLTDEEITYGRVNINTHSAKVVRALLSRIPLGCTYADPTTTDDNYLSESAATTIAGSSAVGDWLHQNGSDDPDDSDDPFTTRGGLASIEKLKDGTAYTPHSLTQTTDGAREEIIGKIANICTTRPNFFTVIVVAQMIRDYPTGIKGTRGVYDDGVDEILAEQKIMAVIRRDAFANTFSTLRFEYLDE